MPPVTIISIIPFAVQETKPGIFPSYYHIPAAKKNDFEILHVEDGFYYLYLDESRGHARIDVKAKDLGESVVRDYVNAQICLGDKAYPGLLVVDGAHDKEFIRKNFRSVLDELINIQKNWFMNLLRNGDDLWNKFHKHQVLSDLHRYACDYLGQEREWNIKPNMQADVKCPACYSFIHPEAAICPHCHIIVNEEKFKKFKRAD